MSNDPDIKDFAERVERLCDFFLAKVGEEDGRDGSPDIKIIEDLKHEAANIHMRGGYAVLSIQGLDDYMRGHIPTPAKT